MDILDSHLDATTERTFHPSIIAAMGLAKNKMNRYYSLTDDSEVYRVAMGESPSDTSFLQLTPLSW